MPIRLHTTLLLSLTLASAVCVPAAQAQNRGYPPQLDGAQVETYKRVGDVKLSMYIFTPAGHKPTDQRPAAVFFFGGGWRSGSPQQFEQQCKYLASRGMVAMTADYRVSSRHNTQGKECVADAKSAVRWARQHADRLGIDPERILAGGGSAGGHIAACTGTITGFDESEEDLTISSRPNAMALFNPALVLASVDGQPPLPEDRVGNLAERMGVEPRELSPFHHVKPGIPPTVIFHGKADTTVPFKTTQLFEAAMKQAGNRCELIGYDGQPHGFFNFGRGENKHYVATVRALDQFLKSLGYLEGEPTIGN